MVRIEQVAHLKDGARLHCLNMSSELWSRAQARTGHSSRTRTLQVLTTSLHSLFSICCANYACWQERYFKDSFHLLSRAPETSSLLIMRNTQQTHNLSCLVGLLSISQPIHKMDARCCSFQGGDVHFKSIWSLCLSLLGCVFQPWQVCVFVLTLQAWWLHNPQSLHPCTYWLHSLGKSAFTSAALVCLSNT